MMSEGEVMVISLAGYRSSNALGVPAGEGLLSQGLKVDNWSRDDGGLTHNSSLAGAAGRRSSPTRHRPCPCPARRRAVLPKEEEALVLGRTRRMGGARRRKGMGRRARRSTRGRKTLTRARKTLMKEWNIDKLRKSLPEDLSSLSVLTICHKALTGASVLPADGASAQLPNFNLHSLKELHLLMLGMKAVNLSNLYLFLKTFQCPNLERLFVQFPDYRYAPMEGSVDQVWEEPPEDGLDNLVMVKVMDFNWNPAEVQLVSFLLRKARSLRKLLIVSRNVTPVDLPDAPEADLSLLKEALVNGKIMFTESDNAATQPYHDAFIMV